MAAAAPFGLAIGLTMGALGGGGAVLAVPVLVYVFGQDVHAATTASLVVVAAAALAGGAGQADRHEVCWPQVAVFAPTAVVGAVVGSIANQSVGDSALMVTFALLMLGAAAFMWHRSGEQDPSDAACPPLQTVRTTAAGITVGALTGFFGVGGGFLVVPMLALVMSFPVRRAIGTSLVIVALVSLVALGAHLARGADVELGLALAMGASAAVGGYVGSRLSARLPSAALGQAFAVLVVAVAGYVIAAESLV